MSQDHFDRTLVLSGDITDDEVKGLIESIYQINEYDGTLRASLQPSKFEVKPIKLIINTNGGSVHAGLALIGAIEMSVTPVHTFVLGKAFSMGLLIALAGHQRFAHRFATFMYHELSAGMFDKVEAQRRAIKEHERLMETLDSYILERSEIPAENLGKETLPDWYFSAADAMEMGVIDYLVTVPPKGEETEIDPDKLAEIEAALREVIAPSAPIEKKKARKPKKKKKTDDNS